MCVTLDSSSNLSLASVNFPFMSLRRRYPVTDSNCSSYFNYFETFVRMFASNQLEHLLHLLQLAAIDLIIEVVELFTPRTDQLRFN